MLRSDRVASGHSQRILQEDNWSWRIESRPRTQFEKIRTTPTSTPIFHRNVAYASKRRPYSAIAIRNDLGGRLRRFGFKVDVVGMVEGMAFVSWHGLGFKHCRALHSQDGGSRWRAVFDENTSAFAIRWQAYGVHGGPPRTPHLCDQSARATGSKTKCSAQGPALLTRQ